MLLLCSERKHMFIEKCGNLEASHIRPQGSLYRCSIFTFLYFVFNLCLTRCSYSNLSQSDFSYVWNSLSRTDEVIKQVTKSHFQVIAT